MDIGGAWGVSVATETTRRGGLEPQNKGSVAPKGCPMLAGSLLPGASEHSGLASHNSTKDVITQVYSVLGLTVTRIYTSEVQSPRCTVF